MTSSEVDTAPATTADTVLIWLPPFEQVGAYASISSTNDLGTVITFETPGHYIAEMMLLQNGGTTITAGISFASPSIIFNSGTSVPSSSRQCIVGPQTLPAGITSLGLYCRLTFRIRDMDFAGGTSQRNVLRFLCMDAGLNGPGAPNLSAQSWFRVHRVVEGSDG